MRSATKYSRISGSRRISLQPSPRCLRRTAIVPPRPRIPDGCYPPCGIPLDAPFGGCTVIICISADRGAARSAKGSQILLSNSGTRIRSGLLLSGRIGKNKEGKRHADCERERARARGKGDQAAIPVVKCSDMPCIRKITFSRNLVSDGRCLGTADTQPQSTNRTASPFNCDGRN